MPISYRAEPMVNRERKLWRMIREGRLQKPVIGEEQHHSSWLFGDPATPVLKAYVGDPVRIRLVHAAVKETHVFHQHVYQWHAEPRNQNAPIVDSITISPQTAHTIELLYGAGSSQGAIGDAIFHCHLYPHFHEGMWGILRTFDRRQDGTQRYPDDTTIIKNLEPLPDRQPLLAPDPANNQPGWPRFMMSQHPDDEAGVFGQKSPIPPWPAALGPMPPDVDYRRPDQTTPQEENHLNGDPQPGALFNRRLFPAAPNANPEERDIAVILAPMIYNHI
jgi:manganese oxidase